mgnify:CR=1 FL=1
MENFNLLYCAWAHDLVRFFKLKIFTFIFVDSVLLVDLLGKVNLELARWLNRLEYISITQEVLLILRE